MNARIKELAEQVGAGTPQSLYGRTDYIVMTEFELEKFAELIVRECMGVVADCKGTNKFEHWSAIKEHFGVAG